MLKENGDAPCRRRVGACGLLQYLLRYWVSIYDWLICAQGILRADMAEPMIKLHRQQSVNAASAFSVSQETAKAQRRPRIDSAGGYFGQGPRCGANEDGCAQCCRPC
jgi:hypothetical protein